MLLIGECDDVGIVNNKEEYEKITTISSLFLSVFLQFLMLMESISIAKTYGRPACLVNNPTLALVQVLSLPLSRSPGTIWIQICVLKIRLVCKLVCLRSPEAFSLKTFRLSTNPDFQLSTALPDVTWCVPGRTEIPGLRVGEESLRIKGDLNVDEDEEDFKIYITNDQDEDWGSSIGKVKHQMMIEKIATPTQLMKVIRKIYKLQNE